MSNELVFRLSGNTQINSKHISTRKLARATASGKRFRRFSFTQSNAPFRMNVSVIVSSSLLAQCPPRHPALKYVGLYVQYCTQRPARCLSQIERVSLGLPLHDLDAPIFDRIKQPRIS